MTPRYPAVLALTERVVRGLAVLNVLFGAGILALLAASLLAPGFTFLALTGRALDDSPGALAAMRLLMGVGLTAVPVTHVLLARLREMLLTVRREDPFAAENARRLDVITGGFLCLEVLRLAVGVLVSSTALAGLGMRVRSGFALTPWVAVLLLFVLARVFEHGARMRADLEGTV